MGKIAYRSTKEDGLVYLGGLVIYERLFAPEIFVGQKEQKFSQCCKKDIKLQTV